MKTKKRRKKKSIAVFDVEPTIYQVAFQMLRDEPVPGTDRDEWTQVLNVADAAEEIGNRIEDVQNEARCDDIVLAMGSKGNWRNQVLRTYKIDRKDRRKPPGFGELFKRVEGMFEVVRLPMLEADDVAGLIGTGGYLPISGMGADVVVISEDKDLLSVPGKIYNPRRPEKGVRENSHGVACAFHLLQSLSGDPTDGYAGCPGFGPKKSARLIAAAKSPSDAWNRIVETYRKAKLSANDALRSARVARILRLGEYEFESGEIDLWKPEFLDSEFWTSEDLEILLEEFDAKEKKKGRKK